MTKEEARQIIAAWLVSSKGEKGQCGYIEGWFYEKDAEAFYMAIEALEREQQRREDIYKCQHCLGEVHKNYIYCPFCGERIEALETEPCEDKCTDKYMETHACDCISRQAAIDAWWYDEVFFGNQRNDMTKEQWLDYITDVIGSIPSAEPKTISMNDLISRQAAIEVVHSYFKDKLDELPTEIDEDDYEVYCDMKKVNMFLSDNKHLSKKIKNLPSAQLKCKTDGDTISRQAAMNELKEMQDYISYKIFCVENNPTKYAEDYIRNMEQQSVGIAHAEHRILELPSAQPEIIRCKDSIVYRKDVVEALYKALRTQLRGTFADSMSLAMSMAQALPSAEQIQTMQEQERQEDIYECPNRLGEVHINYIYCPFCGVRMESEDNDDK